MNFCNIYEEQNILSILNKENFTSLIDIYPFYDNVIHSFKIRNNYPQLKKIQIREEIIMLNREMINAKIEKRAWSHSKQEL